MNGLFTQPRTLMSSPITEQLGCALEDDWHVHQGGRRQGATPVTNVFACGEAAPAAGNVKLAVFGAHRGAMV